MHIRNQWLILAEIWLRESPRTCWWSHCGVQTTVMLANILCSPSKKSLFSSEHPTAPKVTPPPHFHALYPACCGTWSPTWKVLTGWWHYAAINKVHLMCHLLFLEYILAAPRCSQGRLWHCSQIHRIHGYLKVLETCWKFMEKFRGVVGLVKVKVGSYRQHANPNPTILSCIEGLEVLLIFRICV